MESCGFCQGKLYVHTAYSRGGGDSEARCPRCAQTGLEPAERLIHASLLLRNVRSGKVWAVYGDYPHGIWGIHRFKLARSASRFVWQILQRPATELLDEKRWIEIGFGDAWDKELMETEAASA